MSMSRGKEDLSFHVGGENVGRGEGVDALLSPPAIRPLPFSINPRKLCRMDEFIDYFLEFVDRKFAPAKTAICTEPNCQKPASEHVYSQGFYWCPIPGSAWGSSVKSFKGVGCPEDKSAVRRAALNKPLDELEAQ